MGLNSNEKLFLLLLSIWLVFSMGNATAEAVIVDCNGNGDYTSIQKAIDDANPGDSIIVLPGTYTENLLVNKQVSIVSESGNPDDTTILPADEGDDVIHVTADNVTFCGFNITRVDQSYIENEFPDYCYSGIFLDNVRDCLVIKNKFSYNYMGIFLDCSLNNTISNNSAFLNGGGISLSSSNENIVTHNNVFSDVTGIHLSMSYDNKLLSNNIESCINNGVSFSDSLNTTVAENNIKNCDNGIRIGFGSYNSTLANNTVISNNCSFHLYYSDNLIISDNIVSDNTKHGFYMRDSYHNEIKSNIISNNSEYGMYLQYSSNYNLIYNNFFNNTNNVRDECLNTWNATRTSGTNIVGGPYIGGNFWASPEGSGFSQTHEDLNEDGICDSIYAIEGSNADKLPLSPYQSDILIVDSDGCGDYESIQTAVDAANEGDTIVVCNGTYVENININRSMNIVSESGNPADVIIRPLDIESNLFTINADDVLLYGFTVSGANSSKAIFLYDSKGCMIVNNIVESNKYGIYLNNSDFNEVFNNTLGSNEFIGLCLLESDNNTVAFTSSMDSFIGLDLVRSCDNIIFENSFKDGGAYGIYFHEFSNNNSVINNSIINTYYYEELSPSLNSLKLTSSIPEETDEFVLHTEYMEIEPAFDNNTDARYLTSDAKVNYAMAGGIGLFLNEYNTENLIEGNIIEKSYSKGIYILTGSSGNIIYNNYFNNTVNFAQVHNETNTWNITKTAGENIIGGPYMGGNYWANPSDTGFSQISLDMNQDGICDEIYVLDSNNTDYLPLFNPIPYASIVAISPNPACYGDQIVFSGTGKSFTSSVYNYSWYSNIDGQLSNNATFNTSNLSIGKHRIYFSVEDVNGEWSDEVSANLTVKTISNSTDTSASATKSSSSGGGGGGGSGTTGEIYENIAFKDVKTELVLKDSVTSYDFTDENNEVEFVRFVASRNWGKISSTVECLHEASVLVDKEPDGIVYRNVNIWVGKSGFSDSDNIRDCAIGFRVSRSWIEEKGVDKNTIRLLHYSGGEWEELETSLVDEDEEYLHFEAKTSGFSPFAIVAYPSEVITEDTDKQMSLNTAPAQELPSADNATKSQSPSAPGFEGMMGILSLFLAGYYIVQRKRN